jgi:uncharacterized membrane protein
MSKKSNTDILIASSILLASVVFLVQRRLGYVAVWLLLITAVFGYGVRMPLTISVILAVIAVIMIILISGEYRREGYENENKDDKEKKKEPEAHTKDKDGALKADNVKEPYIDSGTTILHAFQKLKPEQVLQMREDTKELMETQKQLVDTLASLGPQIKQGADLMKSFQDMFGGNFLDVVKQK